MQISGCKWIVILVILLHFASGTDHTNAQTTAPVFITGSSKFTSSNLPIFVINTNGQVIVDNTRIIAHLGVIYNGEGQLNSVSQPYNDYDGKIAIELRGSATLSYPKKQYRFETRDALENDLNVSLVGLPEENDWILYGPYDDQSLIRNVLAYTLSNDIGRYASRARLCELIVNGDYRGVYVLLEKIKRDKNRVDIARLDSSEIAEESVTGGYIIKIDKISGENVWEWESSLGTRYQYHYPKADAIVSEQRAYINEFINEFEMTMSRPDYDDPVNGYQQYIDLDSFVDHFILNELAKNVDAYRISAFLHKDRNSIYNKMIAGPIWDFNLSFGKAWYEEDLFLVEGWQVDYNFHRPWDYFQVPFWWEKLSRDSAFVSRLQLRWEELRDNILEKENLISIIDSLTDILSEPRIRNFDRWPESAGDHTYNDEIHQMKQWIDSRMAWIDGNLGSVFTQNELIPQKFYLDQNYPNPFSSETRINFGLRFDSRVSIELYNLNGAKILEIMNTVLPAGYHNIIYNAEDLPAGIYFYRMKTYRYEEVKKMIIVK